MNVTTNYAEALLINQYLVDNNILVQIPGDEQPLFITPRTMENGCTILDTIKINPEQTGPMAPMFTEITLTVLYFTNEHTIGEKTIRFTKLVLEYQYQHPSGSNGHRLEIMSEDGGAFKKW